MLLNNVESKYKEYRELGDGGHQFDSAHLVQNKAATTLHWRVQGGRPGFGFHVCRVCASVRTVCVLASNSTRRPDIACPISRLLGLLRHLDLHCHGSHCQHDARIVVS